MEGLNQTSSLPVIFAISAKPLSRKSTVGEAVTMLGLMTWVVVSDGLLPAVQPSSRS